MLGQFQMLLRGIVVSLFLLLNSFSLFAVECSAVFPTYQPIFGNGSISIEDVDCIDGLGGSDCTSGSFSEVAPVVPSGGSNMGTFNSSTVAVGEHNYYNSWEYSNNNITVTGSGTAVLYFKGSDDIVIEKNARINASGDPSQLLIIVDIGDKVFKLEEDSIVNAFIYVRGDAVFEVRTTFEGQISVEGDLDIKESNGSHGYTYEPVDNLSPGEFCTVPVLASCPDVFPAGYNQATSSNEQLSNFPTNSSSTTLNSTTSLSRGDNFYLDSVLDSSDEITVDAISGSETTARLYLRAGVLWDNVKINQSGNPEDLIVVIDGALQLSGDDTLINAIIYVKGTATFTGGGTVNGAITSMGSGSGSAIYDVDAISNADFNGMCESVALIDHFEIVHDASGSVCATETFTIKACADSACSSNYAGEVSLDILLDSTTVSSATFTGTTTVSTSYASEGIFALFVDNPSVSPANNLVCDDGSGTSCNITYDTAGCDGACAVYFPDSLQGNTASSSISFEDSGQVINDSDLSLTFPSLSDSTGSHNTCSTGDCTVTGSNAPALALPTFVTTSSTMDISPSNTTVTIGPTGTYSVTEMRYLTVDGNDIVTFQASANEYIIEDAYFDGDAQITFNSGTYWFNELEMQGNTQVFINGPVTIYVNGQSNHFDIEGNSKVNEGGLAQDLALVSYKQIHLKDDSTVNAVMYSEGQDIHLKDRSVHTGAISTAGNLKINSSATTTFEYVGSVQIGDLCDDSTIVALANYQLDACSYTGASNEVLDALGTYHGTVIGGASSLDNGQIERAFDASDYSQHIETSIPLPSDFSISTWFKVPTSSSDSKDFVLGAMSTGGDLLYIDRDNSWRWGVYDANSGESNGTYSFSSLDANWHHLVLVMESGVTSLYIDGSFVESLNNAPSGTLKYIGTSFDNVNTVNAQGFRAPLDEFIVFNSALSVSDVSSIYTNQAAGTNWDASTRSATNCSVAGGSCAATFVDAATNSTTSGYIQFEGSSIIVSNPDTVLATATVNNSGSGVTCWAGYCSAGGSASIVPELTPNFVENSSNTDLTVNGTTETIATNDYKNVTVQNSGVLNFSASFNSYHFDKLKVEKGSTVNLTPGDYYIDDLEIKGTGASFLNVPGSGTVRIWAKTKAKFKESSVINGGATGDPSKLFIYYYGDADKVKIESSATVAAYIYSAGKIEIKSSGGRLYGAASAAGELKIKDGAQVWYVDNLDSTDFGAACGVSIDHFQIIHDGTALTCAAETVTIKACTNVYDGSCTESSDEVTLNVQATGSSTVSENITFTGNSSASISYTTAETATLSIDSPSITPTNSTVCNDNSAGSCELGFDNTGFQFLSAGVASNISTQLSGKPSNIDYNSAILSLQAIKTSPITGACEAAIISNVDIELAAKCENPSTCAFQQVIINSTAIPTVDNATALTYSNVSLDFGSSADNTAEFTFTYPDAGQMKLYARYNIPVGGSPSGDYMTGNSNSFVVRPFGFYVEVDSLPISLNGDADDDVFKRSGENFQVKIKAVQWEESEEDRHTDVINEDGIPDGVPDSDVLVSLNAATGNFGNESPSNIVDTVKLTPTIVAPALGDDGVITNFAFIGSSFSNGVMTRTDVSWSEVGIVKVNANLLDNSYLGSDDITGAAPLVGRFYPVKFSWFSSSQGDLNVEPSSPSFAYVGQQSGGSGAIQYSTRPSFIIQALNSKDDPTLNYTFNDDSDSKKDFMKLTDAQVVLASITTDTSTIGVDGTLIDLDATISGTLMGDNGVEGKLTFTMDSSNQFSYQHIANSRVDKFDTDIDIIISSIIDTDGGNVILADTNGASSGVLLLEPTAIEVRFGRWYIPNSYGSELEDIKLPMYIQYWNGDEFVTNDIENLTAYDGTNSANFTLNNTGLSPALNTAVTDVNGAGPLFLFGEGELILEKPSDGSQGQIRLIYDTAPSWLQYDWDNDSVYDDAPSTIATFGLFRGNDRIISWREVGN